MISGEPVQVKGVRRRLDRRSQRWMALAVLAVLALLVWDLWRGRGPFVLLWLVYLAVAWGWAFRSSTVVDATGIRRPWRLRRSVSWDEVEAVAAPRPGFEQVRLLLVGGRSLTLDDVPAEESAAVAELGGRELRRPAAIAPRPIAPQPIARVQEPTDAQRSADVDRRTKALAAQRVELDAQARLRPRGLPRRPPGD